ncbi:hypothetical protein MMC06_005284 [Schaereria dolodes]|nr:hypothetical protein [Schaereria dolodes]
MSESDTSSAAVARAESYFLVNSIVSNSLTFALGPRLLDAEESPDTEEEATKKRRQSEDGREAGPNGGVNHSDDVEQGPPQSTQQQNGRANHGQENEEDADVANEQTSLLPDRVLRGQDEIGQKSHDEGKILWKKLPLWTKSALDFCYAFLNAPLIGAVIGAVIGLVPPLHRAFFNDQQEGGIFNAWLTSSVKDIGSLFAALQIVVVGVKLSGSLRNMKRGEESGNVPWTPMILVLVVRFVIWPVCVNTPWKILASQH